MIMHTIGKMTARVRESRHHANVIMVLIMDAWIFLFRKIQHVFYTRKL